MKTYAFPGIIENEILSIGAQQVPYMRTQEFSEINKDSEKILLELIDCPEGKTIIYTGSGTGAMDAIVSCYVATKKKAFIIDGGSFGHRWVQLCEYYGCSHYVMKLDRGHDIDYNLLDKQLEEEKPDVFLVQHHETSTGQLYDLPKIGKLCKKHNISLVVDVISSFLIEDISMKKMGIDICITSSQKGLNIPPGLSIIFLSKDLINYPFGHNNYYFDFQENLNNLHRGQTSYSPATLIYLQLNARLHQLKKEGVENHKAKVRECAKFFRQLCQKYGWEICAQSPSCAITGFQVNGLNKGNVFRALIDNYNTFVMPGGIEGFLRVSHMGIQSKEDLEELALQIHEIEKR